MAKLKNDDVFYRLADDMTTDVFDFVRENGFLWIPTKDKRPLVAWKSKGMIFRPDDVEQMQAYKAQRVDQVGILTEQNHLVIIDCDVVLNTQDERARQSKYKEFNFFDNFNAGAVDLMYTLANKAKETNNKTLLLWARSFVEYMRNEYAKGQTDQLLPPPYPFNCMVLTPSGGMHFYFKYDKADTIKGTVKQLCDNVDIRAHGGLIVSPYSVRERPKEYTENKKRVYMDVYLPIGDFKHIPELPSELAQLLQPKEEQPKESAIYFRPPVRASERQTIKDAKTFATFQEKFIQDAKQGKANDSLNYYAFLSARIPTISDLEVKETFTRLAHSYCNWLKAHEVAETIKSAINGAHSKGKFAH